MKKFLILFLLGSSTAVWAKTYYVAPSGGSDSFAGTNIAQPWATWQKAFNTAIAGDIVYFRGGVWMPTVNPEISSHSGTYSKPICFFNYPGEVPILDCSNYTSTLDKMSLLITGVTHIKLSGLTVRNNQQIVYGQWVSGISVLNCGHITLDRLVSTNTGGYGYWLEDYDSLYVTNCDSYNNYDLNASDPGNRSDGFSLASGGSTADTNNITVITGCRSWNNSDDGFEITTSFQLEVSNCWSFENGRYEYGAGQGFKFQTSATRMPKKRRVHNNIAANNRPIGGGGNGFSFENLDQGTSNGPVMELSNNTVFNGAIGFRTNNYGFNCATRFTQLNFYNNLYFNKANPIEYPSSCDLCNSAYMTMSNNTWLLVLHDPWWETNPAVKVTDADFVSLDDKEMLRPRKSDGSLPDINFMKLTSTSDLIDKGINVGFPYSGSAPDLGAFEYGTITFIRNPLSNENLPVEVYPNPARESIIIRINDSTLTPDFIQIVNLSGTILFQVKLDPNLKEFTIPINLKQGLYIVHIGSGKLTMFTQKLVVSK